MDEEQKLAYEAGYDSGKNGANETNCHFSIFSTHDKMKAWERGHTAGKKAKQPNGAYSMRKEYFTNKRGGYKLVKDREERIDAGKQMAQPPENPLNAQPSMINIVHPTDDELRSRRKELLEDLDYISGALREQPSQQNWKGARAMSEPIRYNVQSKTPGAPVSWEFQSDPNGQWLDADSALTCIRDLERDLDTLRTLSAELEDSRKKVLADNEYLRDRTTREALLQAIVETL